MKGITIYPKLLPKILWTLFAPPVLVWSPSARGSGKQTAQETTAIPEKALTCKFTHIYSLFPSFDPIYPPTTIFMY